MKDEYGIREILNSNNVDVNIVLPLINDQLNKVCGNYMMDSETIRKAAFTEIKCFLLQALIKTEDNDELKIEINKLVDSM